MKRLPAVAGQFYPGDSDSLTHDLEQFVPGIPLEEKMVALAVMSPHAGYMYSGAVAGETLARVIIPEAVIILGPNHHGQGAAVALSTRGAWRMPMGEAPINEELADILAAKSEHIQVDDTAHRFEHSLEVQVPFLQYMQPKLTIIPLVISHLSYRVCAEIGQAIAAAVQEYDRPVLIVASTDMTHYESREVAKSKDMLAIGHVEDLDPEGLYNTVQNERISMCGIMPTTIALTAAKALGAEKAELVRYTDSGAVSGDTRQVVGYAGMVIS